MPPSHNKHKVIKKSYSEPFFNSIFKFSDKMFYGIYFQ